MPEHFHFYLSFKKETNKGNTYNSSIIYCLVLDSIISRYFSKEITGTWSLSFGKTNANNNYFDYQTEEKA